MNNIYNPQDPYHSYQVAASAGCGKTYQLSQRFLYLIAAGAHPASILTVTFTKKAAAEMRARIIEDAAKLWSCGATQDAFDEQIEKFWQQAPTGTKKPRSALTTADLILSSTQQLRISTIDATLFEWTKRFAAEALGQERALKPLTLLNDFEQQRLHTDSWDHLAVALDQMLPRMSAMATTLLKKQGLFGLKNYLDQLTAYQSRIFLTETRFGIPAVAELPLSDPEFSPEAALTQLKDALVNLSQHLTGNARQLANEAIVAKDLPTFFNNKLFNSKKGCLSGTYFREKTRKAIGPTLDTFEQQLQECFNDFKKDLLNQTGAILLGLYRARAELANNLKASLGVIDFNDMLQGCYKLFTDAAVASTRRLLQLPMNHLLLDEFQDTNQLQWSIFGELAKDLLSRTHDLNAPNTVFIVGDAKQSIYGFREADATLMNQSYQDLKPYGMRLVPLNASYRTTDSIMRFTNHVFTHRLPNYPQHSGARHNNGTLVNPDISMIKIFPLCTTSSDEEQTPVEKEAELVATTLHEILNRPQQYPVYDKGLRALRPIAARDCAILFRKGTHAATYEAALRKQQLATLREKNTGLFGRCEINDALCFLRYLAHPHDLLSLITLLKSPCYHFNDQLLMDALQHSSNVDSSHLRSEALLIYLSKVLPDTTPAIEQLHSCQQQRPHHALLKVFVPRYLSRISHYPTHESEQIRANLDLFCDLCLKLEREQDISYASLVQALVDYEESDNLGNAATTPNAISLLTIHKAKGLEYPLVVLVDCASPWDKADPYWVRNQRDHLTFIGTQEQQPGEDAYFQSCVERARQELRAESWRLLYVALTRARQYLIATAHHPSQRSAAGYDDYLEVLQTAFTTFVPTAHVDKSMPMTFTHGLEQDCVQAQVQSMKPKTFGLARPEVIPDLAAQLLVVRPSHQLDASETPSETTSASQFDPELGPAELYGSLVHALIEAHIREVEFNENGWALHYQQMAPQIHFAKVLATARQEVSEIWQSNAWQQLHRDDDVRDHTEVSFIGIKDNALIRGAIDLVIETTHAVHVVDFKTTRSGPHVTEQHRLQLQAYGLAAKDLFPNKDVNLGVFFTYTQDYLRL